MRKERRAEREERRGGGERRAEKGIEEGKSGHRQGSEGLRATGRTKAFTIGEMVLRRGWVSFTYALG